MRTRKIFSIPGRMRLNVEGLKNNLGFASNIENILMKIPHIKKVNVNSKTGNILLIYEYFYIDESKLLSCVEGVSVPIKDFSNTDLSKSRYSSIEQFKEEKSLAKRLSLVSLAAAVLLIFSSFTGAIAALILGLPIIIYFNTYLALKYTSQLAFLEDINVDNYKVIRQIQNLRSIQLHPSLIFDHSNIEYFNLMNCLEIESMISNEEIEDPINENVRSLVKDLRRVGINNVSILISEDKNGIIKYTLKTLGLEDYEKNKCPEMVIVDENSIDEIKIIDNRVILCVSEGKLTNVKNINIVCRELNKIPWFIKNCMSSSEYLIRSQATAISINIFGVALVCLGYLSPAGSIVLYIINMLGNMLYLKNKIIGFRKVILHGNQRRFINA